MSLTPCPLAPSPTLEEWMDDAITVLDAAGSSQAAIIGDTEGGPMAMLLAATYPRRRAGSVLVNTFARWQRAHDYPDRDARAHHEEAMDAVRTELGSGSGDACPHRT